MQGRKKTKLRALLETQRDGRVEGKLKKVTTDRREAGLWVLFIMLNYAASCPFSSRDPETVPSPSPQRILKSLKYTLRKRGSFQRSLHA